MKHLFAHKLWIFLSRKCEANSYNFEEHWFCTIINVTFIKSTVYVSYIVPSTEPHFFSAEGRGHLFEGGLYSNSNFKALGGVLIQRAAASLKLGAYSSINGIKFYMKCNCIRNGGGKGKLHHPFSCTPPPPPSILILEWRKALVNLYT